MDQIPVSKLKKEDKELQIIPLGDEMPYDFKKPHRHDYFEFFVFSEGGGSHFLDFVEYPIVKNSIHIVFPTQIHLLKRAGARGKIVICQKDFMNLLSRAYSAQLYQQYFASPFIVFQEDHFQEISRIILTLDAELKEARPLSTEVCRNYMSIFITWCIRQQAEKPTTEVTNLPYSQHQMEMYRRFMGLLEEHFLEKPNVAFYASQLTVTPKVLNNCISKVTGKTCTELVQERTLVEAKRLLLYSDESSKEIAYTLNFKDSSYFTRFFTKMEGKTPKEFKAFWEAKYRS
jgi:AraC family transcriptional regulator, transcriptional activator of pobA